MDFVKLVQSADDAVYEVMAWIMMVPKSFFHVLFQPKKSIAYVKDELEKKPDDRFDEYLSPVILWFLVGPLQNTIVTVLVREQDYLNANIANYLFYSILGSLIFITSYTVIFGVFSRQSLKKSTLKKVFYLQCYVLTPYILFVTGADTVTKIISFINTSFQITPFIVDLGFIFSVLLIVAGVFLAILYETILFQVELGFGWSKSFFIAILIPTIFSPCLLPFLILNGS